MDIKIRGETIDDYDIITEINNLAFGGTGESQLIIHLRKTKEFIPDLSLIALFDERVVGHILFYPITIEAATNTFPTISLAPMAIHPDYQYKGIGTKLVIDGLQRCKDMNFDSVIVLGHPEYYPRFGFTPACKWGLYSDFEAPDEAFMALELKENALPDKSGKVVYPKEYLEV
ncbi:MAG: N-acetyltransferase [Ignavibacterium sp.]|nr:MAG: N-acetyltransferase [Ignavibacterium sp.]